MKRVLCLLALALPVVADALPITYVFDARGTTCFPGPPELDNCVYDERVTGSVSFAVDASAPTFVEPGGKVRSGTQQWVSAAWSLRSDSFSLDAASADRLPGFIGYQDDVYIQDDLDGRDYVTVSTGSIGQVGDIRHERQVLFSFEGRTSLIDNLQFPEPILPSDYLTGQIWVNETILQSIGSDTWRQIGGYWSTIDVSRLQLRGLAVPEPETFTLMLLGLAALGCSRRQFDQRFAELRLNTAS